MKRPFLPVHKILVATFAGISFASFLVAQPSLADPNQPFDTLESDKNNNSFFGGNSDLDMFELMHRAKFGPLEWNSQQQNQQIDDAAAAFKARQNQLLQGEQPKANSPTTSGANPLPLIVLPASEK
jgi:hypothetical protein